MLVRLGISQRRQWAFWNQHSIPVHSDDRVKLFFFHRSSYLYSLFLF